MKITHELLKSKEACKEQAEKFRELFSEGVTPTRELCLKHAHDFNWAWAAKYFLPPTGYKVYRETTAPALKVYRETTAPALKVYRETTALAFLNNLEV